MKMVEFTKDVLPIRAGEQRIVPDDVAAACVARGEVAPNPPDWPGPQASPAPQTRDMVPARRPNKSSYLTK